MIDNKDQEVKLPPFKMDIRLIKSGNKKDWSHDFYDIEKLHSEGRKGKGVKIAVLDTGVDLRHSSFKKAISEGRLRSIDARVSKTDPIDRNGHGTWVVSRYISDGNEVLGFAPESTVISYKVLNDNGSGSLNDVIRGAKLAIAEGVDIISTSLGWSSNIPLFNEVVKEAKDKGILWISASGNNGKKENIDYPALYGEVISVGSHDKNRMKSLFSDFGIDLDVYSSGENVLGAYTNNREAYLQGTSMSTPSFGALLTLVHKDIIDQYGKIDREILKKLVTC